MSDKKTFRTEEARKNYEKAERQRAQAQKRKAFQAKKDELTGKATAWLKQNPKKAAISAAAVIAAVVLVWLGCKYFVGPDGSIPNFFGTLVGKQANWLVVDTAEDSRAPRYQHLADYDIPDGYHLSDFSVFADGMQQDFYCTADEKGGVVQDVYVSGAKNMIAAEYPSVLLSYQMHMDSTEPREVTIAGKTGYALTLTFDESDTDGEGMAYRSLCMYIDTDKGACISVMISSPTLPLAELPDEAALMAEAEMLLAGLTLVK